MKVNGYAVAACLSVLTFSGCGGGNDPTVAGSTVTAGATTEAGAKQPTSAALLKPVVYDRFTAGLASTIPDVSTNRLDAANPAGSVLELLSNDFHTVTVATTASAGLAATVSGFSTVTRRDGGILMLCRNSGTVTNKSAYVLVSTSSSTVATQAEVVRSASELAGKSFYQMEDCSYTGTDGNPQNLNTAANASTLKLTINADGSTTVNDGGSSPTAAQFAQLLAGGSQQLSGGAFYLTVYKFLTNGAYEYYGVVRGVPTGGTGAGYAALFLPR